MRWRTGCSSKASTPAWSTSARRRSSLAADLDLLVVGGPTHAFGMSRAGTRADAVRQGAPSERATTGLREWLEGVELDPEHSPGLATFDTRVSKVRWLPQAAALSAARAGRQRGLEPVARPLGFLVDEIRGPLVERELDRAAKWGRRLGLELVERATAVGRVRSPGRDRRSGLVGTAHVTVVPAPGSEFTVKVPPCLRAR